MDPNADQMHRVQHVKHQLTDAEQDLEILFQALRTEIEERWGLDNHHRVFLALDSNRDGIVDAVEVHTQLRAWNIFPTLREVADLLRIFAEAKHDDLDDSDASVGLTVSQFTDFMRARHAVRAFDDGYDDASNNLALPGFRSPAPRLAKAPTFESPAAVTDFVLPSREKVDGTNAGPGVTGSLHGPAPSPGATAQDMSQLPEHSGPSGGAGNFAQPARDVKGHKIVSFADAPAVEHQIPQSSGAPNLPQPPRDGGEEAAALQLQQQQQVQLNDFKEAFVACEGIDHDGFVSVNELVDQMTMSNLAPMVPPTLQALGAFQTRMGQVQYKELLAAAAVVLQQYGPWGPGVDARPLPTESDRGFGERPIGYGVQQARQIPATAPPAPQWRAPWMRTGTDAQNKDVSRDATGDATLSEEEQRAARLRYAVDDLRDQLAERWGETNFRKAFLNCDTDRSGAVGAKELRALLRRVNLLTPESDDAVEALLRECGADANGGRIKYADFVRVLSRQANPVHSSLGVSGATPSSETNAQFKDRGRNNRFGANDAELIRMVRDNAARQITERQELALSVARKRQLEQEHAERRAQQESERAAKDREAAEQRQRANAVAVEQREILSQAGNPVLQSAWAGDNHAGVASRLLVELSAALHTKYGNRHFQRAFLEFDRDRSGFISPRNVLEMFHERGIFPSQHELQTLIAAFQPRGQSDRIYFQDFVKTLSFATSNEHGLNPHNNRQQRTRVNNGSLLSEHDGEFQDFTRAHEAHTGPRATDAASNATQTSAPPRALDFPEWHSEMMLVFDSCSGGLMQALHIGKDSADAATLLQQLLAHPLLGPRGAGGKQAEDEILELMSALTFQWLRAGGQVSSLSTNTVPCELYVFTYVGCCRSELPAAAMSIAQPSRLLSQCRLRQ